MLSFFHRLSTIKGPKPDRGLILWWNKGIRETDPNRPKPATSGHLGPQKFSLVDLIKILVETYQKCLNRFLVPEQSRTVWGLLRHPEVDLNYIPGFDIDSVFHHFFQFVLNPRLCYRPVFLSMLSFFHRLSTIKGPKPDRGLILWWNKGIRETDPNRPKPATSGHLGPQKFSLVELIKILVETYQKCLNRFLVPEQSRTVWGLLRHPEVDLNYIPGFDIDSVFHHFFQFVLNPRLCYRPVFLSMLSFFHRLSTIKGPKPDRGLILWWNKGIRETDPNRPKPATSGHLGPQKFSLVDLIKILVETYQKCLNRFLVPEQSGTVWGLLRHPEVDLNYIPGFDIDSVFHHFFHRLSMIKGHRQDRGLILWWNRGIN